MAVYRFPVNLEFPGGGGPGVNVWDLRTTGEPEDGASADLDTLSEAIRQFYADLQEGLFPAGYVASFEGEATTIGSNPQRVQSPPWTEDNDLTDSPPAPLATMMVMTIRTSSATRRGQGRKFLGPVAEGTNGGGTPTASALQRLRDAASALLTTSQSFANGAIGVQSEADGLFRDATQLAVRDYFAVLTSRRD